MRTILAKVDISDKQYFEPFAETLGIRNVTHRPLTGI
jgi:hypothetical protein